MNIMQYKKLFFTISLFFLIPSLFSLMANGLNPSIDFVGGSQLEVRITNSEVLENSEESLETIIEPGFENKIVVDSEINERNDSGEETITEEIVVAEITPEKITEILSETYHVESIRVLENDKYEIIGENISNAVKDLGLLQLQNNYTNVLELRFQTVGATLSKELLTKTLTALFLVALIITIYVWKQFDELKYGVCAILAMFHDSIILLGVFSLLGYFFGIQVDVLFVTALLTTLSFSVHDTIVVYDRIRELKRKKRGSNYLEIVNMAVVETLSRSINNSVTIILMLLALALLGGDSIRWFAVALLVGAVTGTYSSTFTAAPLLLMWDEVKEKRAKLKR